MPVQKGGGVLGRERQKRWDRENLATIACKVRMPEYRAFRCACAEDNVTMYALVRRLVREWMDKRGGPPAAPGLVLA